MQTIHSQNVIFLTNTFEMFLTFIWINEANKCQYSTGLNTVDVQYVSGPDILRKRDSQYKNH